MSEVNGENRLGDAEEVKKGRLEADADIYQNRETLTPSENIKKLAPKDRWYYFKDYYLKAIIVVTCFVLVTIYVFYTLAMNKEDEELFVGYVDCLYDMQAADTILEEFAGHIDMRYTNDDFAADSFFSTWTDNQWLTDYVDRGQLDVLILDEQMYKAYAARNVFLDLSKYIDVEKYSDYIVYAPDYDGKDTPTAFQCDSIKIYSTQTGEEVPAYIAVLQKSSQIERSVEYLKFATTFEYEYETEETSEETSETK